MHSIGKLEWVVTIFLDLKYENLRIIALRSLEKREDYLVLVKDLYKKALLEFNDIRGYVYLNGMSETNRWGSI